MQRCLVTPAKQLGLGMLHIGPKRIANVLEIHPSIIVPFHISTIAYSQS